MSKFLSYRFNGGKSYATEHAGWATNEDKIKLCAVMNGNRSTMENAHNYTPGLLDYISSLQDTTDNTLLVKVEIAMKKGLYFHFTNGKFVSSKLCNLPMNKKVYLFDKEGRQCDNMDKTCYIYFLIDGKLSTWVSGYVLADENPLDFDGNPYIRLNESATPAAKSIIYPAYLTANRDKPLIDKVLKAIVEEMTIEADDLPLLKALISSSTSETVSGKIISWACSNGSKTVDKKGNPLLSAKTLETLYTTVLDAATYRAIDPTRFVESNDKIIINNDVSNQLFIKPIESIMFNTTRAFIDSVSAMVYDGDGASLSHGVSGSFLNGLQASTESEAVLLYTPHGAKDDPLDFYDLGGYVDGFIYVSDKRKLLMDTDWFTSSRAKEAGNRNNVYRYLYHTPEGTLVFGNRSYYNIEKKEVIFYNSAKSRYAGRYDEQLLVKEDDIVFERLEPGSDDKVIIMDQKKVQEKQVRKAPISLTR